MMNLSDIVGKPLICLSTAKTIGTIENAIFDDKFMRLKILKIYNENDDDTSVKYIEWKKIRNFDNDAFMINFDNSITYEWNTNFAGAVNPINHLCYNQDGKSYGVISDIEIDSGKVNAILLKDTALLPKQIISYSDTLLIINDTDKPFKLPKPKLQKTIPTPKNDDSVTIHSKKIDNILKSVSENNDSGLTIKVKSNDDSIIYGQSNAIATPSQAVTKTNDNTESTSSKSDSIIIPEKISEEFTNVSKSPSTNNFPNQKYSFLIGKILSRSIISDDGKTIASSGQAVTQDIVMSAKNCGRLVQLAIYSD